eukprot:scaffold92088_cov31-Tisochrysis_lutea.AAC.5
MLIIMIATIVAADARPVQTTASIGKKQRPRKPTASPSPDVMMVYPPLAVDMITASWKLGWLELVEVSSSYTRHARADGWTRGRKGHRPRKERTFLRVCTSLRPSSPRRFILRRPTSVSSAAPLRSHLKPRKEEEAVIDRACERHAC